MWAGANRLEPLPHVEGTRFLSRDSFARAQLGATALLNELRIAQPNFACVELKYATARKAERLAVTGTDVHTFIRPYLQECE